MRDWIDEGKDIVKHVPALLIADAIAYLIGRVFEYSSHIKIALVAGVTLCMILYVVVRKMLSLKNQVNILETSLINPNLTDYANELYEDGQRHPYPYSYRNVSQEAFVDKFGNYKAVYIHEAVNDSDQVIDTYAFHLLTSDRLYFAALQVQAWVTIDGVETLATSHSDSGGHALRRHKVSVDFPRAIRVNQEFKVRIAFTLPGALKTGQDGDAIDIARFKSVTAATMKLKFEEPVERPVWYELKNDGGREKRLRLYDWQPTADPAGTTFVLTIPPPGASLKKTVYTFFCQFKACVADLPTSPPSAQKEVYEAGLLNNANAQKVTPL